VYISAERILRALKKLLCGEAEMRNLIGTQSSH
jgi:hypothetical protein